MNWDNQDNKNDQDPWGRKNQDDISFDDLIKKFSAMFSKQTQALMDRQETVELTFLLKKLSSMPCLA